MGIGDNRYKIFLYGKRKFSNPEKRRYFLIIREMNSEDSWEEIRSGIYTGLEEIRILNNVGINHILEASILATRSKKGFLKSELEEIFLNQNP